MIYIIDDQITYNSDDCTLSHIPTQESLSLSISSGRLFEQLLNSGGEILSRDTLLTEVWDRYGLRGSNSNLNQYLSLLRRALAAYGCQNLIMTLPKIGIRLNPEIRIVRQTAQPVAVSDIAPEPVAGTDSEVPPDNVTAPEPSLAPVEKPMRRTRQLSVALILLAIFIVAFSFYIFIHPAQKNSGLTTVPLAGGCEAVLLKGLDVVERESIDQQILQMLRENNQSCSAGRRIYFDKNTAFTTTNYGRTMLSACNLDERGHIISCDNVYYLDWRMN